MKTLTKCRVSQVGRTVLAAVLAFACAHVCWADEALPPLKDYGLKDYVYTSKDLPLSKDAPWTLICRLPYNAQFKMWIRLRSDDAGKVVKFDSTNPLTYCRQKEQSYTTVKGEQEYEMPEWISGEGAKYTIPAGVTVLGVKYHETGYNTEFVGSFKCNDEDYNTLWRKATRTCYLCMRDHFMDCPDRERSEWLGDAVLQMEECFYAFDLSSHKIIRRFIRTRQINGLPGQNLIAHGEYGDWMYYLYTGDLDTLKFIYSSTKGYLDRYAIGDNGLPVKRNDGWDWYDWGKGYQDNAVIQVGEYYGAIKALKKMAVAAGKTDDLPEIEAKIASVAKNFDKAFWKEDGYRSGKQLDERANAMAVCSGLADRSKWPVLAKLLDTGRPAGPDKKVEIKIDKAQYGVPGDPARQLDLRGKLQEMVDRGEYSFEMNNEIAGRDPAYGTVKSLELEYRLNGKKISSILGEKEKCTLSKEGVGGQCGPYFERWTLEALCIMGREDLALMRMYNRYELQIDANITTLYEYVVRAHEDKAGIHSINYTTLNHGWNVPNSILSKFIAGVAPETPGWGTYHVLPQEAFLRNVAVSITTVKGHVGVEIQKDKSSYRIQVESPAETTAIIGIPKKSFTRLDSIAVGDKTIWNGAFVDKVKGIAWHGEEDGYVKFKVASGTWDIVAMGAVDMALPKKPSMTVRPAQKLNKKSWTVSASIDGQSYQAGPWGGVFNIIDASACNAIDGDSWTGWRTMKDQVPGDWFAIDMQTPQTFSSVILDNTWAIHDSPAGYALYATNDKNNWGKPIAEGKGSSTGITVITFKDQQARYIKIEQAGAKNQYWSIFEVDVYRP